MKCPFCRENRTDVYNTRTTRFGTQIWRRRRCLACGESFTSYEQPDLSFLRVKRSAGQTERYSRATLFTEIYAAFAEVADKPETIDAVTDTVEARILDLQLDVVPTNDIAEIVLSTLKHFSMPAFLRYLGSHSNLKSSREVSRELRKYR